MYDFKYQTHHTQRFNTYKLYIHKNKRQLNSYQKLRDGLFFILFVLSIFIMGAFSLKKYQEYNTPIIISKQILIQNQNENSIERISQISHLEFTTAITNSVIDNLKAKKIKPIDNAEIKCIIKKVVRKIQEETNPIKYTQN